MSETPGEDNKSKTNLGVSHLKRISVVIQYKNRPETIVAGYALSHEILASQVSFFAAQKFPVDEELNVFYTINGEKKSLTVTMKSMHEQISSGRIMNALPTDTNPFPARKFYRCYTSVVGAGAQALTSTDASPMETPVAAEEAEANSSTSDGMFASEPSAEPVVAEAAPVAPKADSSETFASESANSVQIPEVEGMGIGVGMEDIIPKAA